MTIGGCQKFDDTELRGLISDLQKENADLNSQIADLKNPDVDKSSYIELDKSSETIGARGGTITVKVNASGAYTATCDKSWVNGIVGTATFTITVEANTDSAERTATFTFNCGGDTKTFIVTQSGSTAKYWHDKMEKVLIKAGSFMMGSPETQHQVTLTQDFYMGKYEVTNAQFCEFLNDKGIGSDGTYATADYGSQILIYTYSWGVKYSNGNWIPQSGYEDYPVVNVTWYGASEYARWIGGALPTEAQWEYACRAGSTTAYCFGDDSDSLGEYAWYEDNSDSKTHPVGQKKPNAWGLYDMHGNVCEWCADWYGLYSTSAETDPTGPTTGSDRVLRGGGWHYYADYCRSATRDLSYPASCYYNYGFRVCFPSSNTETPYIELDKSSETIGAEGGTITVTVNASGSFVATCTKSWATVTCGTGSCGIAVATNVITAERTATITITCGGTTKTVTITQSGNSASVAERMEIVLIKAGTFTMGSPESEDDRDYYETQHQVTLTQDFYMGKYQVTNAQFCEFLNDKAIGSDGKFATANYGAQTMVKENKYGVTYSDGKWMPQSGYDNYPVVNVTWYGANEYAKWIGGSLPTEAQWEYACRAGSTTAYCFGDDSDSLGEYAWYYDNSKRKTHPVGQKKPNAWGLYDMHGNVREWCSDWYSNSYGTSVVTDPTGPTTGSYRVLRGGGWGNSADYCRSASRDSNDPDGYNSSDGFRVCFPSS